ncbi:MAG: 50S ribosomal protein L3 [Candidatus Brennerbacteria bacterium RIFOXYC1_FULL_41_11]|uniref:Large ribosomal subunit protein uL3 n=1 Tax=Candidatus Brennerbacteria bacterium RIFOXYD1_FULL_41_16 TaxID=1797529 RepID=A0A1G1XJX5_9BACT|nr:MAG: 50S ribosomal protein L3 [Parcubacteria group bacterium GW2011_GWB1_41_4]OGY38758.1 MAG: 50S ribosomal protein L3 [Candidatus Brennerbacteria bacterium RIFOXYB1_FULL_41_13]OGY39041.1 MAG: 50S ribosomal protein L3 [Candidatus Brennerbacteria bacterium RIFOXYC1_FULL_41_11]OGY40194.1 MAG: 50S ribosomal protein L3 [Candidatus Brennerbacteria bacterium RIFOXYD1_FULL_41_16]
MRLLIGKKLGMMQVFDEASGKATPVSLVLAEPVTVTGIKDSEKHGYSAVQVGYGRKKFVKRPQVKIGSFALLKEFRVDNGKENNFHLGDQIGLDIFSKGEKLDVFGISKGRGFAGVVKRHGFAGGPKSHGQKHRVRAPGSIGSTTPQRVVKGKKMAGHMGSKRVSVKNLEVVNIDSEKKIIFLKGAIPGYAGSLLELRSRL